MSEFVHDHSKALKSYPVSFKRKTVSSQANRRAYIISSTAKTHGCCKHDIECKKTLCSQNADILVATLVLLTTEFKGLMTVEILQVKIMLYMQCN